jgi:hypothetical protein
MPIVNRGAHQVQPERPATAVPVREAEKTIPKIIRMDEKRTVVRGNGMIVFEQNQVVSDPWLIYAAVDNKVGFQIIEA